MDNCQFKLAIILFRRKNEEYIATNRSDFKKVSNKSE